MDTTPDDAAFRQLAQDAVRLLAGADEPSAPPYTREAAAALRRVIDRLRADTDDLPLAEPGQDDPPLAGPGPDGPLLAVLEAGIRDDPDFADAILRCVNSDARPDPTTAPRPGIPRAGVAAAAVLLLGVGIAVTVAVWPTRSVAAYCATFREQGERLHAQWNDLSALAAAPGDLADFFDELEGVAQDEIAPDVATLHDGWRTVADQLGDRPEPMSLLATGLAVGAATSGAERRVDRRTHEHYAG